MGNSVRPPSLCSTNEQSGHHRELGHPSSFVILLKDDACTTPFEELTVQGDGEALPVLLNPAGGYTDGLGGTCGR